MPEQPRATIQGGLPALLDRVPAALRSALSRDPPIIFNLSIQRC